MDAFRQDLQKGWVVPALPIGQALNIHGLGEFEVRQAKWRYDAQTFYQHVEDMVRRLNPEMGNLYRQSPREAAKWAQRRVSWSASPIPYKVMGSFGYRLTDGDMVNVFYRGVEGTQLTTLTAYGDKTVQISACGERYFSPEEIEEMFAEGTLGAGPQDGAEWVTIEDFGRLLLAPDLAAVTAADKRQEVVQLIKRASGEADAHAQCMAAYYAYLTAPGEWTRERLREAYEAVPEHERMYLGDMDSRDGDFRRILYTSQKREV